MRNLKECKAEVFLRSEKRIKKSQKIRKRIFSLCIPFCLIVCLGIAVIPTIGMSRGEKTSPDGFSGENEFKEDMENGVEDGENDGYFPIGNEAVKCSITVTLVKDSVPSLVSSFYIPDEVEKLHGIIDALFEKYGVDLKLNDKLEADEVYYIIIEEGDRVTKYQVYSGYLFNEHNRCVNLTEEQLADLYFILGINVK